MNMQPRAPLLVAIALTAALAAGSAGCEGSAAGGGFEHATATARMSGALTYQFNGQAARSVRFADVMRSEECRGGAIGLALGPIVDGNSSAGELASLYLKAPADLRAGTFPIQFSGDRWRSAWMIDGTLAAAPAGDAARSLAPFAIDHGGTAVGSVTIERNETSAHGRLLVGRVTARVDGDAAHRFTFDSHFSVEYPAIAGCP